MVFFLLSTESFWTHLHSERVFVIQKYTMLLNTLCLCAARIRKPTTSGIILSPRTHPTPFTKECVVVYIIESHQTNGPERYFCTAISPNQGRRIVSRYFSQQLQPPYMFRAWLSWRLSRNTLTHLLMSLKRVCPLWLQIISIYYHCCTVLVLKVHTYLRMHAYLRMTTCHPRYARVNPRYVNTSGILPPRRLTTSPTTTAQLLSDTSRAVPLRVAYMLTMS